MALVSAKATGASLSSLVTTGTDMSAILFSVKTILDFLKVESISWWNYTRVFKKSFQLETVSPKISSVLSLIAWRHQGLNTL